MAESDAVICLAEMSGETLQISKQEIMLQGTENPSSTTNDHDYVEGADMNHSHEKLTLDIINVPVVGAVEPDVLAAIATSTLSQPSSALTSITNIPQVVITMPKYEECWTNIGMWTSPYKGYLSSNEELEHAIKMYTEETDSRWVVTAKDKLFSSSDIKLGNFKLFWRGREDNRKAVFPDFDGIPFIMVGRKSWGCHLGRDKCRSGKIKYRTKMQEENQEGTDEKWPLIRSSKKLGCPATLSAVHILKFQGFPMSLTMSEFHRKQTLKRLRLSLMSKHSTVKAEQRFYIHLSKPDEHIHETNPPQDSTTPNIRVDKRLIYKLSELYHSGVLRLAEMSKELQEYVRELYKDGELPSKELCPELYPSLNCLHFFISHAVKVTSLLEMDLGHGHRLVSSWQIDFPNDSWYYQPFASSGPIKRAKNKQDQRLVGHYPDMTQTFLFCCQNEGQRRLLSTYGTVCVLDSPHGKTVIPTYFLMVRTNVGYQVVCTIIMQYWNSKALVEAMQVIKDWNPDWQPQALLVELIEDEIPVLEVLFPDCQVFISFIHRERAWQDYLFASEEADHSYDPAQLDPLIYARTEEGFNDALKKLQESPLWLENERFRHWMEVRWLPCAERWSFVLFSDHLLVTLCSNNGLETLRDALEYTWLENVRSRSLGELLTCLVMDELPKLYKSYAEETRLLHASTRYHLNLKLPVYIRHQPVTVRSNINEVLSSLLPMDVIQTAAEGIFLVSYGGDRQHKVSFGNEYIYPSCDCWTWTARMELCEHFCAVFKEFDTWHWCQLSPLFTGNPIFRVDQTQLDTPYQEMPRCTDPNQHDLVKSSKEFIQVTMDDFGAEEVLEHDMCSNGDITADNDVAGAAWQLNQKQTTCKSLLEQLSRMSEQVTDTNAMDYMTNNLLLLLKQMQQYDEVVADGKRNATSSPPNANERRKKAKSGSRR